MANMEAKNFTFVKLAEGKIFVNNQLIDTVAHATSSVLNPKDNTLVTNKHTICGKQDVDQTVAIARKALSGEWESFTGLQRAKCLNKWANLLEQNAEEAAYYESICSGRLMSQLQSEVVWIADVIRYYAGWCDKIEGEYLPDDDGFVKIVRHEPLGVCCGITPWNGPLMVLILKAAPALAAGNTFILKPPEKSPFSSLFAAHLLREAGLPAGVFNVLTGDGSTGELLSHHLDIDKISFTGSIKIGRAIAAAANSSNMKRITLELGGKSPCLILPDADIAAAIRWTAIGVTMNAGQVCVAPSRVYVHESIADKVIAGVKSEFERIASEMGKDPQDYSTSFAPVVNSSQKETIHQFIESGKKQAELVTGGYRYNGAGNYVPPTLFINPAPDAMISKDEIFGPVLCISTFATEDEAIKLANDSNYGLAAYVFTKDIKTMFRITKRLQAGLVGVNAVNILFPNAPFGGYKSSGVGKELGKYAILDYMATKTIFIPTTAPV